MTAWDDRIVGVQQIGVAGPLASALPAFVRWQVARWPRLADARAALGNVSTRSLRVENRTLQMQFNPARAVSTTAKVDAASIQARPCFLCPANLPAEEHGLPFGEDWVVLPNPAPILMDHLVIAHREHIPQSVHTAVAPLLDFAHASQGVVTGLYNGPKSGASAPDHLHLQAVASDLLPEEQFVVGSRIRGELPGAPLGSGPGFTAWRADGAGREILGIAGTRAGVERALRDAIEGLVPPDGSEPALNLLARADLNGELLVLVFPRGAHRPAVFFADDPVKRIVSPGIIDMAGVIVTVRESDFDQLDGEAIGAIYRDVTLPPAPAEKWYEGLSRRWSGGE